MYDLFVMAAEGEANISSDFSAVLAEVWDGISNVATTVAGNKLLLIPIVVGFAGAVIGLGMKLMGIRRRRRG